MVLDFKKLNKTSSGSTNPLHDGFLTVLEQLPGKFAVEDQTEVLRKRSVFWSSAAWAVYYFRLEQKLVYSTLNNVREGHQRFNTLEVIYGRPSNKDSIVLYEKINLINL